MSDIDCSSEALEVDPNKLIQNRQGNALGFEKAAGFEEVTNFSLKVVGYVGDGRGHVTGYILEILLAVLDPLDTGNVNMSK